MCEIGALLVNVMHDMHDKLSLPLCIQNDAVHCIVLFHVLGVSLGNVAHPRDEPVIAITNVEL